MHGVAKLPLPWSQWQLPTSPFKLPPIRSICLGAYEQTTAGFKLDFSQFVLPCTQAHRRLWPWYRTPPPFPPLPSCTAVSGTPTRQYSTCEHQCNSRRRIHWLQGGVRTLAEYDVESGCCLAAVELPISPATLAYSPDGNLLVTLLQDRSVLAFYGGGLADRSVLLPGSGRTERVQQGFHITVTAVSFDVTRC